MYLDDRATHRTRTNTRTTQTPPAGTDRVAPRPAVEGDPGSGVTPLRPLPGSAPPIDDRTAQHVATHAITAALAGWTGTIEHGGEHYETAGPVRANTRPGQLDGIVTFHLGDGTRERAIAVTVMVAATGLAGA